MSKPTKTKSKQAANGTAAAKAAKRSPAEVTPRWWPHLNAYRENCVLTFASPQDLEAAIDLLWTDELRELPHDTADGQTVIVPAAAVPYFTRAGLRFVEKRLRSLRDLRPEEVAKLRRRRAPY